MWKQSDVVLKMIATWLESGFSKNDHTARETAPINDEQVKGASSLDNKTCSIKQSPSNAC